MPAWSLNPACPPTGILWSNDGPVYFLRVLPRLVFAAPLAFPHRGNARLEFALARPRCRSGTLAARTNYMLLEIKPCHPQKIAIAETLTEE